MQNMQFSIEIEASKEQVWSILWNDKTFRDWGNIIDEGQYMVGQLKEGNEIQFMSSSGYGVTSLVEKLIPNKFILFRQMADTMDNGKEEREKEWTGGRESYKLEEINHMTSLIVEIDVPKELIDLFKVTFPKALQRVKELAESAD